MKRNLLSVALTALLLTTAAAAMSTKDRDELEAKIRALDKESVHKLVTAVEADPLSEMAEVVRPALMVYFEPLDYTVCLDQIGFLMDAKPEVLMNVFWQVVFSSGDFFLQQPEQSRDRLKYMQAGLESGLRVYERILTAKPGARHAKLDELVRLRSEGRLGDYVRANPCVDR